MVEWTTDVTLLAVFSIVLGAMAVIAGVAHSIFVRNWQEVKNGYIQEVKAGEAIPFKFTEVKPGTVEIISAELVNAENSDYPGTLSTSGKGWDIKLSAVVRRKLPEEASENIPENVVSEMESWRKEKKVPSSRLITSNQIASG